MRTRLTGAPGLVAALCVVLAVQAAFVLSYVGALHHPLPHQVALGVVGDSPLPPAVAKQFSLKITPYRDEAHARAAIDQRKVYAAFVGSSGARLIVAPAASAAVASTLDTVFTAAAAASGQKIEVVQVHALPSGDSGGNVSFLVVMALIVGGYLASTIGLAFGGGAATPRRRLASLSVVAVIGALLTDTFAGPVLGAIPTSKFLVLWCLFTLVMLAVAFATAALQSLLGPAGTLIVVVVFVIFGAPAAGGSVPSPFLPGFWRTFGPYLPAGAGTTAVRNTIYFDGNDITASVLILAAYLIAGAVAVVALKNRQSSGTLTEGEASAAAAAVV